MLSQYETLALLQLINGAAECHAIAPSDAREDHKRYQLHALGDAAGRLCSSTRVDQHGNV